MEDLAVSVDEKRGMPRRAFVKSIAKGAAAVAFGLRAVASSRETMADISDASQGGDEERLWRVVKSQFMYEPGLIYMNNGTLGVCPRPVFNAVVEAMAYQEQNPSGHYQWGLGEVREKVAKIIGASKSEIVHTRNVTEGMSLVAAGLPLEKGDEVLTTNHEHPGGLGCWQVYGLEEGDCAQGASDWESAEERRRTVEHLRSGDHTADEGHQRKPYLLHNGPAFPGQAVV